MSGSTLIQRMLQKPLLSRCWSLCRPGYHALLRQTVYRRGTRKRVAGRYEIRVCFDNRRLQLADRYQREIPWLLTSVRPDMCILDIGANIGLISIVLGLHVPQGRVFAFEPSPIPFRCLRENIRLNHLENTVTPLPFAVGEQPGSIPNEDPYDTQHSPLRPPGERLTKTVVRCVSVDSFCKEHAVQPDCIKIDVEGYEPYVLWGAQRTLAQNRRMILFLELHPFAWSQIEFNESRFQQLLDDLQLVPDGKDAFLDPTHVRMVLRR